MTLIENEELALRAIEKRASEWRDAVDHRYNDWCCRLCGVGWADQEGETHASDCPLVLIRLLRGERGIPVIAARMEQIRNNGEIK